jgi:hypothetical protein
LYKPELGLIGSHPKTIGKQTLPSNEYAIRHINCLAWKVLMPVDRVLSEQIENKVEALDFTKDLYDPLFGITYNTPYDSNLYRDCYPNVRKQLPSGSSYYPYKSAVFLVTPFVWANIATRLDPLCWSLEVLNDYWKNGRVDEERLKRCRFDGDGIKGGLMKFLSEYSTLRLAVYAATNAAIGQLDTADACANILLQLQWKGKGYVQSDKMSYVNRPDHEGGFYRAYKHSRNSYVCSVPTRHVTLKYFPSFLRNLLSVPEMPTSDILTDAERTLVSVASLMLYRAERWR